MNRFYKYSINISLLSGSVLLYKKYNRKFYNFEEIKKHNNEDDAWVSYKGNVYDITKFIQYHPGGKDKILLAAGKPLEPYWNIYQQHYKNDIENMLKDYKIGVTDRNIIENDPYINEPDRGNGLKTLQKKPYNGESDLVKLREKYITPIESIFVRNHHPVH